MRLRKLLVLSALCLALVLAIFPASPAGEAGSRHLPGRAAVRVSVRSFSDLVEKLDEFVPAVAAGTSNPIGPGFVAAMINFSLPIPKSAFLEEEEVQLLFESFPPKGDNACVLFRVSSFDDFLFGMQSHIIGNSLEKEGEDAASFTLASGMGGSASVYAKYLGDGRVALAEEPAAIEKTLGLDRGGPFLPPAHEFDSLLSVVVSPERLGWTRMIPYGRFERLGEKEISTLTEVFRIYLQSVLPPDVFREGLMEQLLSAYMKKLLPLLSDLIRVKSLRLDLKFDQQRLNLALGLEPAAGGILEPVAASLAKHGAASNPLASRIGNDAMYMTVSAPPEDIFPDFRSVYVGLAQDVVGENFPDLKDRLGKCYAAFAETLAKGRVGAGYYDASAGTGNELLGFSLLSADGYDAYLKAMTESADLGNTVMGRIFQPKYQGVKLLAAERGDGSGSPQLELTATLDTESGLPGLLANSDPELADLIRKALKDMSLGIGKADGAMLEVSRGAPGSDAYAKALKLASGGKGERSFLASADAREALADLRYAQVMFGLADSELLFQAARNAMIDLVRSKSGLSSLSWLPEIKVNRDGKRELFAFGLGADAFGLAGEIRIPVPALSGIIAAAYAAEEDGWGDDGDDWEDGEDGEDGEDEDGSDGESDVDAE